MRRHRYATPIIILEGEAVWLESSPSYLDITLENKRTMFGAQLRTASAKVYHVMSAICRLMPNVREPSEGRRRLFTGVVQSVLLYGAPNWVSTALNAQNVSVLLRVHCWVVIRCTSSYCTVSYDAVKSITYIFPIELLALERCDAFYTRERGLAESKTLEFIPPELMGRWLNK